VYLLFRADIRSRGYDALNRGRRKDESRLVCLSLAWRLFSGQKRSLQSSRMKDEVDLSQCRWGHRVGTSISASTFTSWSISLDCDGQLCYSSMIPCQRRPLEHLSTLRFVKLGYHCLIIYLAMGLGYSISLRLLAMMAIYSYIHVCICVLERAIFQAVDVFRNSGLVCSGSHDTQALYTKQVLDSHTYTVHRETERSGFMATNHRPPSFTPDQPKRS